MQLLTPADLGDVPLDEQAKARAILIVSAAMRATYTIPDAPADIDPLVKAIATAATLRMIEAPAPGVTMEVVLGTTRQWTPAATDQASTLTGYEIAALTGLDGINVRPGRAKVYSIHTGPDGAAQIAYVATESST